MPTPTEVMVYIQLGGAIYRFGRGVYSDIKDAITDPDPDFDENIAFMLQASAEGRARIAAKLAELGEE